MRERNICRRLEASIQAHAAWWRANLAGTPSADLEVRFRMSVRNLALAFE
jgi:hypothetical protein